MQIIVFPENKEKYCLHEFSYLYKNVDVWKCEIW